MQRTNETQVLEEKVCKHNTMPKSRVVSHAQVEALLGLLEANPDIARGRVMGGALASQSVDDFWRNTSATLNSMGDGTTKDAKAWKTYWHELKYRARKRDTEIRQHARGTGGGPAKKPLTITESRIFQLLGEVSYAGHPEVQIPLNIPNSGNSAPAVLPSIPPPTTSPVRNQLQNAGDGFVVPNPPPSPHLSRGVNPEIQNAGCSGYVLPNPPPSPPLSQGINPELQNADSSDPVPAMDPTSPPPPSPSAGSSDSVPIVPRRGRTGAQVRNSRPYRRHRYDDPPVWARRYEEQRLRIDRDRARLLERLVEIAQQALELYQRSYCGRPYCGRQIRLYYRCFVFEQQQ